MCGIRWPALWHRITIHRSPLSHQKQAGVLRWQLLKLINTATAISLISLTLVAVISDNCVKVMGIDRCRVQSFATIISYHYTLASRIFVRGEKLPKSKSLFYTMTVITVKIALTVSHYQLVLTELVHTVPISLQCHKAFDAYMNLITVCVPFPRKSSFLTLKTRALCLLCLWHKKGCPNMSKSSDKWYQILILHSQSIVVMCFIGVRD